MSTARAQLWRFFDAASGIVQPGSMLLPNQAAVEMNTPAGCVATQLELDPLCQRVELLPDDFGNAVVQHLVDWRPPQPEVDEWRTWAWDEISRRWQPVPTLAALQRDASAPLLAELAELDAKLIRPTAEALEALMQGQAVPEAAALRLSEINAEKAALRHLLAQIAAATSPEDLAALTASPDPTPEPP